MLSAIYVARQRRKKGSGVAASQGLYDFGMLPALPTSAGNPPLRATCTGRPRRLRRKKTGSSNTLPPRLGSPISVRWLVSEDPHPVFASRDGVVVLVAGTQARHDDPCVARDGVSCCCIS